MRLRLRLALALTATRAILPESIEVARHLPEFGMLAYLTGHALVKGALFMSAGILLATLGGIDEVRLRGRGRGIMPVGIALAVAGLLLGGAPIGLLDDGSRLIDTATSEAGAD